MDVPVGKYKSENVAQSKINLVRKHLETLRNSTLTTFEIHLLTYFQIYTFIEFLKCTIGATGN